MITVVRTGVGEVQEVQMGLCPTCEAGMHWTAPMVGGAAVLAAAAAAVGTEDVAAIVAGATARAIARATARAGVVAVIDVAGGLLRAAAVRPVGGVAVATREVRGAGRAVEGIVVVVIAAISSELVAKAGAKAGAKAIALPENLFQNWKKAELGAGSCVKSR